MKLKHWMLGILVFVCCNAQAQQDAALRLYGQSLLLGIPPQWHKVHDGELGGMHSVEFVPAGETMAQWQELICLQAFDSMAKRIEAAAFLAEFSAQYQATCRGEWFYQPLGDIPTGVQAMMGCSRIDNQHGNGQTAQLLAEVGYYQVLQGQNEIYLLHRSSRGTDFKGLQADYQLPGSEKLNSLRLSFEN
ncbi:hypothetical protein [Shewanella sp. GXUN23E]|uniref:hypothetical protein n=1 Tax=Shewanella sp. GXUN23E TaxID=3422498 RepID=UPI003D7CD8A0